MSAPAKKSHFLTDIIDADLAAGRHVRVVTRFPPEPNGYLHIGHAKSICLNFGLARDYGGDCHLRMDDTNPTTEDVDFVESIQEDVKWLGFSWTGPTRFASDYFDFMAQTAQDLITRGLAYVDSQTVEQVRDNRGSFEAPGVPSPFRERSVAENLALFARMRAGQEPDGSLVLRGRIDMAHPNLLMRDPLLFRIRHAHHHRTGDTWCIYPMYDFAHPLEDALEGITHSICTLEFESNRELYDWVLDNTVDPRTLKPWSPRPHQYEFARLALGYTVMSKRKLLQLVQQGRVRGWDDPRMPTLAGMRRRGVTPEALRDFADLVGIAKNNSLVDIGKLEFCIRQDLEKRSRRGLAVLDPLAVTLTNYPQDKVESLELPWLPQDPSLGRRAVPFSKHILIEREDFAEEPPEDWKRMAPGREIRLYGAYFVTCTGVDRDAQGKVVGLRCSVDLHSKGGEAADGRQPAGTVHWLDAQRSVPAAVRLYERLLKVELPQGDERAFLEELNPNSERVCPQARVEPALAQLAGGTHVQFVRTGYFFSDPVESQPGNAVWNRTITLRDTWGKSSQSSDGRPTRKKEAPKPQLTETPKISQKPVTRAVERAADAPWQARFAALVELGVEEEVADFLSENQDLALLFHGARAAYAKVPALVRWFKNDLAALLKSRAGAQLPFAPAELGACLELCDSGAVSSGAARQLLAHFVTHGGEPKALVSQLGLAKVDDAATLTAGIEAVLAQMPKEVERYRAGEAKLLGVFLGAALKQLRGADPAAVRERLLAALQ